MEKLNMGLNIPVVQETLPFSKHPPTTHLYRLDTKYLKRSNLMKDTQRQFYTNN